MKAPISIQSRTQQHLSRRQASHFPPRSDDGSRGTRQRSQSPLFILEDEDLASLLLHINSMYLPSLLRSSDNTTTSSNPHHQHTTQHRRPGGGVPFQQDNGLRQSYQIAEEAPEYMEQNATSTPYNLATTNHACSLQEVVAIIDAALAIVGDNPNTSDDEEKQRG